MGSRIKKILGWGLTDLNIVDDKVEDERLNLNSILVSEKAFDTFEEKLEAEGTNIVDNYVSFLNDRYKQSDRLRSGMDRNFFAELKNDNKTSYSFNKLITMNHEFGIPEVLISTPAYCYETDWYRSDDIIDYMEASLRKEPSEPYVEHFSGGIYPFSGMYLNKLTGGSVEHWKAREFVDYKKGIEGVFGRGSLGTLAEQLGFSSIDEAAENVIEDIPEDLKALFIWGDLFTDTKHMYDLKPMIYCYWS